MSIVCHLGNGTAHKTLNSHVRGPRFDLYHYMCQNNAVMFSLSKINKKILMGRDRKYTSHIFFFLILQCI